MSKNGQLAPSELARIYHPEHALYLQKDAAASWNTMYMFIRRYAKISIYPNGPISAYRNYYQQVEAKRLYGSNAATPGTSNHGWGLAVDLASQTQRTAIDRFGAHFGWAKKWSDASWEWWHLKYREGVWKQRPDPGHRIKYPVARLGSGGRGQKWYVRQIQRRLRAHGYPLKNTRGEFNALVEKRVKEFQRDRKMRPDGVVGEKTWRALRAKPRFEQINSGGVTPGGSNKPQKTPVIDSKPPNPPKTVKPPKKPSKPLRTPHKTSKKGVQFIADWEGFFAKPYNDPVGYATVGYGYLLGYRPVAPSDHKSTWIRGQQRPGILTEPEARRLLAKELAEKYEPAVRPFFAADAPLHDAEQQVFDALVSFVYNLGTASLNGIPGFETIGKAMKTGNKKAIADAMLLYTYAGGKQLPGLVRRRKAERRLLLKGNYSTDI